MSEGLILHYVGVRLRVTGVGNLNLILRSYDGVKETELRELAMSSVTNREELRKANFKQQAAYLEFNTDTIDETFRISKIVVFVKPSATGWPG